MVHAAPKPMVTRQRRNREQQSQFPIRNRIRLARSDRWPTLTFLLLVAILTATAGVVGSAPDGPSHRQETIMDLHPVAYWPLNERNIERVVGDRTHNHNDGFYEGLEAAAPGSLPGGGAAFFGIPGINLTRTTAAVQGNAARTIIAWINTTNDGQAIVATGTPDVAQAFNVVMYSGCGSVGVMGFAYDFYPCGGSTGIYIPDGVWHMVAAVYDGVATLRLYVDGTLDNQASGFTYATTGQHDYIGRSNYQVDSSCCAFPFKGSIRDVAIFDYALTTTEISLLANPVFSGEEDRQEARSKGRR